MSFVVCTLIVLWFVLNSTQCAHWFVLPVLMCGMMIGADAVDWFRARFTLIDPAGFLGLLGLHFFFLAPLLHVYWDQWMGYVIPPPDWRPWLGGMAVINFLGLLVYRFSRGPRDLVRPVACRRSVWRVSPRTFAPTLIVALIITGLLQMWVYQKYGGLFGYISTYMDDPRGAGFRGMGILFMVSESFPIVALMGFAVYASRSRMARSWLVIWSVLVVYFVLLMLFGGLRGGRGNTIFQLFWGVGMLHLFVRPISKKMMFVGLLFVLGFMYLYGFYKESGLDGLTALTEGSARAEMERKTGRTLKGAILGDLGRSDVQAFLLYRLWPTPIDYEYGWGRTYVGAAALLAPRSLWPDRPATKVKEGTELMFGTGSHHAETFEASNVYGLAGEVMLNYGVLAVAPAFAVLGVLVRRVRQSLVKLDRHDVRLLLMPFSIILTANLLTSDSDNLVFLVFKFGAVPLAVTLMGSSKWSFRPRVSDSLAASPPHRLQPVLPH